MTEGEQDTHLDDPSAATGGPDGSYVPGAPTQTERELSVAPALSVALADGFAEAARQRLGAPLHARPAGLACRTLTEFLQSVAEPNCCFALRRAAGPAGWVDLSRDFALLCVDHLLSGRRREAYLPDRPLTGVERGLVHLLLTHVAQGLTQAWPAGPGRWTLAPEWGCQIPAGLAPEAPAVVIRLNVALSRHVGLLRVCLPTSLLAPATQEGKTVRPRATGPLELSVVTPDILVAEEELEGLAEGDVIPTDTLLAGEVLVRLAGIPVYAAKLGACDEQRAVTLTRKLTGGDPAVR